MVISDALRGVLVVGASGRIGSVLLKHYADLGRPVLGLSAREGKGLAVYRLEQDRIGEVAGDLRQWGVAIIAAGITAIDTCKRDVQYSRSVNVDGTLTLVRDLFSAGVLPVFLSSDYVFSGVRGNYTEMDVPDPVTEYGAQKVEVEKCLMQDACRVLVIRLSRIISSNPKENSLLSEWHAALVGKRTICCASDQWFAPTEVQDVAAGLDLLIASKASGLYHLCCPCRWSRAMLVRELARELGLQKYDLVEQPTGDFQFLDGRGRDTTMNPGKFIARTGHTFKMPGAVVADFVRQLEP